MMGGKLNLWAPRTIRLPVSRIIPIINPVMAADARGALRKGRYPTTSTKTPRNDARNMVMTTVITKMTHPGINEDKSVIRRVAIPQAI